MTPSLACLCSFGCFCFLPNLGVVGYHGDQAPKYVFFLQDMVEEVEEETYQTGLVWLKSPQILGNMPKTHNTCRCLWYKYLLFPLARYGKWSWYYLLIYMVYLYVHLKIINKTYGTKIMDFVSFVLVGVDGKGWESMEKSKRKSITLKTQFLLYHVFSFLYMKLFLGLWVPIRGSEVEGSHRDYGVGSSYRDSQVEGSYRGWGFP